MRLITFVTLLCFGLGVLAALLVSPILFLIWLLPQLIIKRADKLKVASCYTHVWREFLNNRGSILFTKSKYGWWGHVMWVDKKGSIWEYQDHEPGIAYRDWKPLPPLWFHGDIVKKGDIIKC